MHVRLRALDARSTRAGHRVRRFERLTIIKTFADKPTLLGNRVTLRPIRTEDAFVLDQMTRSDSEIGIRTGSVHSRDEKVTNPPIEAIREIYGRWAAADDRLVLAVLANDGSDMVLGEVSPDDVSGARVRSGRRTRTS